MQECLSALIWLEQTYNNVLPSLGSQPLSSSKQQYKQFMLRSASLSASASLGSYSSSTSPYMSSSSSSSNNQTSLQGSTALTSLISPKPQEPTVLREALITGLDGGGVSQTDSNANVVNDSTPVIHDSPVTTPVVYNVNPFSSLSVSPTASVTHDFKNQFKQSSSKLAALRSVRESKSSRDIEAESEYSAQGGMLTDTTVVKNQNSPNRGSLSGKLFGQLSSSVEDGDAAASSLSADDQKYSGKRPVNANIGAEAAETIIDEPTKADAPHPHSSTIFSTFNDKGCAHREKMQEARAGAGAPTVRGSLAHSHSKSSPRIPKTAQKSKHDSSVTADVAAGLNIIPHNLQRRLEQRYGSTYRSDLVSVFNSRTSVGTPIQRAGSSSHPNSVNNSAENLLGISTASATPTQLPNREDYNHNNSSVMHFSTQTSTPQYHHLGADSSFKTHLTSPSTAMYANGDLGVDFQSGSASAVPGISFLSEDDKLAHVQALTHINTQVNASLGPSSYTQGTPAPVAAMDVVTSNFVHSAKKVDISMALSQTLQLQVKIVYLEGYLIIAVVLNCFTV
jgi:hypothetical protein